MKVYHACSPALGPHLDMQALNVGLLIAEQPLLCVGFTTVKVESHNSAITEYKHATSVSTCQCFQTEYHLVCSSNRPPIHPPTHPSIHPPTHSFLYPSIYPPIHLPTYPPTYLTIYLHTHLPFHLSGHSSIYTPIYPSICSPSHHPPTHPATQPPMHTCLHPPMYPLICRPSAKCHKRLSLKTEIDQLWLQT